MPNTDQDMSIVRADYTELEAVTELYAAITRDMRERNIDQWDEYYPTIAVFQNDLHNKQMYGIQKEGQWIGAVVVNEAQDTEFEGLSWQDQSGKAVVIHRLAVHPDYQGQGIGKKLLQFAEMEAAAHPYTSIRLDAYSANLAAIGMYEKAGYTKVGEVRYPFHNHPFYVYEKIISKELRP
ncbi:GNAT family N-acetyltransferase [Paenibacillus sp. RC67]|uniref:GNAT family N-acetyltransferase n=1 Tax=Paenibacillus sp. RC67 TaxID=3039392 RepID=UPI0024ADF3B5|nr:GNAT family N-acetyltransferase [Paenibacillus sp. RC67]